MNVPTAFNKSVSLQKKHHIDFSARYPITEEILEALRQFTMDEAIQDPNDIRSILITGGGSLMHDVSLKRYKADTHNCGMEKPKKNEAPKYPPSETIGEQLRKDLSEVLELQGISGIEVKTSKDPRLSIL